MMNAEFLIILVITLLVLMVRAKIKSIYDEKTLRREMNRLYREKRDVKVVLVRKREKLHEYVTSIRKF